MDRNSRILLLALGIGGTSALLVWAIVAGAFAGPSDRGWIYNYQTLITGVAALAAAWITVRAMKQQTEMARADEADRTLTRYAIALFDVMEKCQQATPPAPGETQEDALVRLKAFDRASDDPTVRAAMVDGVLGDDRPMLAQFVQCCRASALARVFHRDDQRHENMVWPLYIALTNGITHRQGMLRGGRLVAELYSLSTIDQDEARRAFVEVRVPNF